MSVRGSWWSITINNPTEADRQSLKQVPSFVKRVKYQDEVGDEGTLHIQGAVNTAQVRFSQIKQWLPRAHIEVARNPKALLEYVSKSETAVINTQMDTQPEYMTMEKALCNLAYFWQDPDPTETPSKTWEEDCYWKAVREILAEAPGLVQLYTNPQMLRAWKHTRDVWLKIREREEQKMLDEHMAQQNVTFQYSHGIPSSSSDSSQTQTATPP